MLQRDFKLLNCRQDASKREIEAITKITYLALYPDNDGFKQWLIKDNTTVDMITYEEGEDNVVDFFQVCKRARDRLCQADHGNYQKAICTHTHDLTACTPFEFTQQIIIINGGLLGHIGRQTQS